MQSRISKLEGSTRIGIAILIAVICCAISAFAESDVTRFEAGPIVSGATVTESGLNPGYGARAGINLSRIIGVEGYFAKHPLGSFESSPGTVVDQRSSFQAGIDLKLTRRFRRYPFAAFALGGPAIIHSTSRWTYTGLSQTIKNRQTALHVGGGIELQVHRRWVVRLDLTDTATFSAGSRDNPGKWEHHPDVIAGSMFRF